MKGINMKAGTATARRNTMLISSFTAAALLAPLLGQGQTITYVDLHPPGAQKSYARATAEHQQTGRIDGQAAIWTDTMESAVILGGPSSIAFDTTGSLQVGYSADPEQSSLPVLGSLWAGSFDSRTFLPQPGAENGVDWYMAMAIHGSQIVGADGWYSSILGGSSMLGDDVSHGNAWLWDLAQGTVVKLNPPGINAAALDTREGQQVGIWNPGDANRPYAALWTGSASSFVNLHPAGSSRSIAYATSGVLQGGFVAVSFGKVSYPHAVIWHGSVETMEDVNPIGAYLSVIRDAIGDWQVGYANFNDPHFLSGGVIYYLGNHAGLWKGTAESFVDLHSVLDQSVYSQSFADGMWLDGRKIKIAGWADTKAGQTHAILWTITLPDEEPPIVVEASAGPDTLWPPNNKMTCVKLDALVTDNSGEAAWGVVDIECNEPGAEHDMEFVNDHTVSLRATRSGQGAGRIYTVWLQAIDAAENLSEPFPVEVVVPHDLGKNPERR